MPGKLKENKVPAKKKPQTEKGDTWADDQTEHEYYYDDAHGYETFDPSRPDEDDEDLSS